jgi:hypothetical protein
LEPGNHNISRLFYLYVKNESTPPPPTSAIKKTARINERLAVERIKNQLTRMTDMEWGKSLETLRLLSPTTALPCGTP